MLRILNGKSKEEEIGASECGKPEILDHCDANLLFFQ